jgi:hypothetical protein
VKPRPAPTPEEVADLAAEINRRCKQGWVCELPAEAVRQLYTAVAGDPGAGLRWLQNLLAEGVTVHTREPSGAYQFIPPAKGPAAGEGRLATGETALPGRLL